MAKTVLELLAGEDMEGGEGFCDSIYNFLKNQGKDINLITNSGFGVWSQSDAAKGLAVLTYDVGSAGGGDVPDVGDAATGAVSGATGKIISYTITGGAFATNDAVGVLTLGAVTGCFQDNETINFTDGETALVNGDANVGVENDPMNNDSTGDWTDDGANITLAFVAAEYTVTTNAANQRAWIAAAALTAGKIYKIELDIKDGTAAVQDIEGYFNDGAAQYGQIKVTAAGWDSVYWTFECATTTAAGLVGFRIPTSLAGSNIEIRRFSCYEITPCCTAADNNTMDNWYKTNTVDTYREHFGSNTKDGSFYAFKFVPTLAATQEVIWSRNLEVNLDQRAKWAGRPVTLGAWVKTSTASHSRLRVRDSVAGTYSSYHTGGGDWEWLEVTHVVNSATTYFQAIFDSAIAPAVDGSTIIYVSQAMLIFGSSLGEGMYQPRLGEIIQPDKFIVSNLLHTESGFSDVAMIDLNLEADSDALLPKGAKAVWIFAEARDSGSAGTDTYLGLRKDATKYLQHAVSCFGLANDSYARAIGLVTCNENGDIQYQIEASGAGTFDIFNFIYHAVQVN